jgi:hypothetical protein
MEREDVHTGRQVDIRRALGSRCEEHVLGWRKAVDGRGVVFCEVVAVEPGTVHVLQLFQPLSVRLGKRLSLFRFDVIKDAELKTHLVTNSL